MPLAPGARLGTYEIQSAIGAGGMGEVYRAADTNLKRAVAIKVLPAPVAADAERLARFQREAEVLASLNHPNIAAIYGLEKSAGVTALVMELVDGPTLADRIAQGAVRIDEALPVARQIAEALEAAHEQRIIHRDLKPANIKVRPDGTVKVLDFGLAKALDVTSQAASGAGGSMTPTITTPAMTLAGVILGTAAYMSPEQARGKPIDTRTDVWAFGCVLYEMLTARRAFGGETVSDTIARILERDADWTRLPPDTPGRIRLLLRRCLEKDSRRRLRDMGDARLELEHQEDGPAAVSTRSKGRWMAASVAGLLSALTLAFVMLWMRPSPAPTRPVVFNFTAPVQLSGAADEIGVPIPSPDGRQLAFVAHDATGRSAVWLRRLDSTGAQPIAGSEGAIARVFWSPDARFIGFFADGKLKKIDASGGAAVTICASPGNLGASWGADDTIIFAPINRSPLHRVSAAGGTPEPITALNADRRENSHRFPAFLPDGRRFLFTARSDVKDNNLIYVGSLDSHDVKPLVAAQSQGRYAPPGYLLFAREGTLMAQPFDVRTLSLSREGVPLASRISHATASSSAGFAVSADGTVLVHEGAGSNADEAVWYSRDGVRQGTVGPRQQFTDIQIAPNGRLAAAVIPDPESGNRDIWLLNLASGSLTRLTSNPANDWQPAWSPDSRRIAFATDRHGRSSVYSMSADGADEQLVLRLPDRGAFPKDWSDDGRFLALIIDSPTGVPNLWAMSLSGDRSPFPLSRPVTPNTMENQARLSPDGQWVAYTSNESGRPEVYVKPFSRAGKVRLSTDGGVASRWRGDGREIFYRAPNGDIMAVAVQPRDPLEASAPVRLLAGCARVPSITEAFYDVAKDGNRFLMICPDTAATAAPTTVWVNWTMAVRR